MAPPQIILLRAPVYIDSVKLPPLLLPRLFPAAPSPFDAQEDLSFRTTFLIMELLLLSCRMSCFSSPPDRNSTPLA